MLKAMSFYFALLKTSIRASISKRGAFLIECALMVANNLIFFIVWWIFFRQFDDVAGWNFHDMILLLIVGTGAYGLVQICFGGIKDLSKMIVNGDIDPFMTQPKNLLLHIAGSKSFAKGWGHLFTAVVLILLLGVSSWQTYILLFISMITGSLVVTSINVMAHSLPFWMGSMETVSKKYCDALFLFALYPTNIYSGFLQVIMFTLLPAGVITFLPVELIRSFTWVKFVGLIAATATFCFLACYMFYSGLKRYESGNKFGSRL